MSLISKGQTLVWYLEAAARSIKSWRVRSTFVLSPRSAASDVNQRDKEAGRRWCESELASTEALCRALKLPTTLESLQELFAEQWQAALARDQELPETMGGAAHIDLLFHLAYHAQARCVVETGVARGWSSLALLLAVNQIDHGKLISIDMPYAKLSAEDLVGAVVPTQLRHAWQLIRRPDRDALPRVFKQNPVVDFVHHDSDKSYRGRRFVYRQAWRHLRGGGLLLSDDVEDNLAFRDFAQEQGAHPWIVSKPLAGNYAGILVKP